MTRAGLAALLAAGIIVVGCGQKETGAPEAAEDESATESTATAEAACEPAAVSAVEVVEITPGLSSKTLISGCGEAAQNGQIAVVHYTGWLYDAEAEENRGNKFDSSRDRQQHFEFPLGGGSVIQGWDKGVAGMTIGEVRELTIAPELAYGNRDMGVIAPGSTLVFEVELAGLEDMPADPAPTQ